MMVSAAVFNYYNSMNKQELVDACLNQHIANTVLLHALETKHNVSKTDFKIFKKMNEEIEQLKLQNNALEQRNKWLESVNKILEANVQHLEDRLRK